MLQERIYVPNNANIIGVEHYAQNYKFLRPGNNIMN